VSGIIYTARVGSGSPDAGVLLELDAIAACVIGGASLMGGRGSIFGACLGALFMASLDNGDGELQQGIRGRGEFHQLPLVDRPPSGGPALRQEGNVYR
jgi:hypothetical protein